MSTTIRLNSASGGNSELSAVAIATFPPLVTDSAYSDLGLLGTALT